MINSKITIERVFTILFSLVILVFFFSICICNLFKYNLVMNSDLGSMAIAAREMAECKSIIIDGWFYPLETSVFGTAQISAIVYYFTHKLVLSAGIACIIVTILICFSILYFAYNLHLSKLQSLLIILMCLMLPANESMAELFYLRGAHYVAVTITMFFSLGNIISISESKYEKRHIILYILDCLLAFVLGIQGMRGILVIYGPLLCVAILYFFYCKFWNKSIDRKNKACGLYIVLLLVISFIGSRLPMSTGVTVKQDFRNIINNILFDVFKDLASALGMENANYGMRICIFIVFIGSIISLIYFLYLTLIKGASIDIFDFIFLYLWISPFLTGSFVIISTVQGTDRYYFSVYFLLAYLPVYWIKKYKIKNKSVLYSFIIIMSVCSFDNLYLPQLTSDVAKYDEEQLLEYLNQNNVDRGYANFDNANKLTVIFDGAIQISPVDTMDKMNMCRWLSNKYWYPPYVPTNVTVAYIATGKEIDNIKNFLIGKEDALLNSDVIGKYHIYIMDKDFVTSE